MQRAFLYEAGRLKAWRHLSLAGCVCLAFANSLGAQLLTADHHEFDPLVEEYPDMIAYIR